MNTVCSLQCGGEQVATLLEKTETSAKATSPVDPVGLTATIFKGVCLPYLTGQVTLLYH